VERFYAVGDLQAAVFHKDGEIRAEQSAQSAVDAVSIAGEFRRVIAFGVGAFGHDEYTLGAELDTKAAPLAPVFDDVDNAMRNLDAVPIQGLSPVGHIPSSIQHGTSSRLPSGTVVSLHTEGHPALGVYQGVCPLSRSLYKPIFR
jgi:isopentenyl phosphate kinase